MTAKPKVAIMVGSKGRGSNMASLITACHGGFVPAEVAIVISPKPDTPACLRAEALRVPVKVIAKAEEDYDEMLFKTLETETIDYICLAGYMFLLPASVVHKFDGRIINIHPALLPKFGGKGMYGMHVHEAVIAAGEKESGCSVHFVNERYDEGAVFHQLRCPVLPEDTPETLAHRVLDLEHQAFPEALKMLIEKNA